MASLISRTVDFIVLWVHNLYYRRIGWPIVDRETGERSRELFPYKMKMDLYIFFNPLTQWVPITEWFRTSLLWRTQNTAKQQTSLDSKSKIADFVSTYQVKMEEFQPSDIEKFDTFEDFFIRKVRPEYRPIYKQDDGDFAVCPSDSRAVVYNSVSETKKLWIKGRHFNIGTLMNDPVAAKTWANGQIASFRLAPQDYHRYHSPVQGEVESITALDGQYHEVDPMVLQSKVDVMAHNRRTVIVLRTKEFGRVLFVAIGAVDVGKIVITCKEGQMLEKGDEIGIFRYGGSSIILAFESGRIDFDQDLLEVSQQAVMMNVKFGQSLGRATNRK